MKSIGKYTGILLIITGILHCIVAIALFGNVYLQIFDDGAINVIKSDANRKLAFWFILCGIFIVLFGKTLDYYIKKEQKPAPIFLGYWMLILALIGCMMIPISGFWLFIPQALIIILSNKV